MGEGWQSGIEPERVADYVGNDVVVIAVVAVAVVALLLFYNVIEGYLRVFVDDTFKVRKGRDNVFDDRPAGSRSIVWLLTFFFILVGGVFIAIIGSSRVNRLLSVTSVGIGVALVAAYYIFCRLAYYTVGYTFSTAESRREWLRGYDASVSLAGLLLILPGALVLFYPALSASMTIVAIIIFILAKTSFILKGIRIFYDKIYSLLYFILYLCTLEIIPIIVLYNTAVEFILDC